MKNLDNKVAIVTGGAQGIGAEFARALAERGAKVVIASRSDANSVVEEISAAGGECISVETDITNDDHLLAMIEKTESEFGHVEILVNNAAMFSSLELKPFWNIDLEEWDDVFRVNVRGSFQCAKAVLPSMRKRGRGKIVNISSGTFLRGAPMMCHYVSSKGGVVGLTRAMARELGDDSICVNCLIVGLTESEGVLKHDQILQKSKGPTLDARIIKRAMVPHDLVGALGFLVSEDSDFMTGQCINVDGGALNY